MSFRRRFCSQFSPVSQNYIVPKSRERKTGAPLTVFIIFFFFYMEKSSAVALHAVHLSAFIHVLRDAKDGLKFPQPLQCPKLRF